MEKLNFLQSTHSNLRESGISILDVCSDLYFIRDFIITEP